MSVILHALIVAIVFWYGERRYKAGVKAALHTAAVVGEGKDAKELALDLFEIEGGEADDDDPT